MYKLNEVRPLFPPSSLSPPSQWLVEAEEAGCFLFESNQLGVVAAVHLTDGVDGKPIGRYLRSDSAEPLVGKS